MTKIDVKLEADYGCGCCGIEYGSTETIEIEISESELEVLQKISSDQVSRNDVVDSINSGENTLKPLHDKIEESFYKMVEEYWLFEAYNECLRDTLAEAMENDTDEGEYTPMSYEDFIEGIKSGKINLDGLEFVDFDNLDDDYDLEDKEDLEYTYKDYILSIYYNWVCTHDHEFIAERIGVDLDACRDEETIDYIIMLQS